MLGLYAATEAGVKVQEDVWKLAREYWQRYQMRDGSWTYTPEINQTSASMTCAGISSLIISGLKRFQGAEKLVGEHDVENCGKGTTDEHLERGIFGSARTSVPATSGNSTSSTDSNAPAGSAVFASSEITTGIAKGPSTWSTNRTSSTASGEASSTSGSR